MMRLPDISINHPYFDGNYMIVEETEIRLIYFILNNKQYGRLLKRHRHASVLIFRDRFEISVNKMLIKPGSHQPYRTATRAAVKNADAGN